MNIIIIQAQKQLEEVLLDEYFPDRHAICLFAEEVITREESVVQAYSKKNAEIRYHQTEEREVVAF